MSNKVDTVMSVFTPANIKLQLADHWQEYNFAGNWGVGLMPQHDPEVAPHISKRPVRRAMTHAINRQDVVNAAGPQVKAPFPTPAAISAKVQSKWIDVGGQFSAMQGGAKQAATIMKDAGYTKNSDGVWNMDGDTVSFELAVPGAWSDWVTAAQAMVAQLGNAGFAARMNRVNSIYSVIGSGEFQLATRPWSPGNARSSFPYFPLNWVFGRADGNAHSYPAWDGGTVKVPAMSGSGTMEVDIQQRLKDLSVARGDDVKPIVQELAWVSHQDLPMIPIIDKLEQSWISTQNLTAPSPDAPEGNVKWPCFHAPRKGKMQWKGE
ncbi:MAG: ABC transporter substrate-binding protein [Halorhabdus sp.]